MEALALYLWYLLSSRDESDSEEEVDLSHVKLPEITVIRKKDDVSTPGGPGRTKKRKRVSFAEPLHKNGSSSSNKLDSSNLPADHYTLVPMDANGDHDYVSSPLVCYRRLPTGALVRTPVAVKGVDKGRQTSLQKPETACKTGGQKLKNEKPLSNPREPTKTPGSVTPSGEEDSSFERGKAYKSVHDWSELLEQFGTKPEGGESELISALSGERKENIGDGDEDRGETCENDSDSDSVEIIWEGQPKDEVSDKDVKNVYRELFDTFAKEDIESAESAVEGANKPDDSSGQSVEQPGYADIDRSGQLPRDEAPLGSLQPGATVEEPEIDLDLGALCDWALSICELPGSAPTRKGSSKETETSDDQPKAKKKKSTDTSNRGRKNGKPIEELSKKQLISRLAKEMRLTQDPRIVMDNNLFKNTFGVSKEFADFLITALSPHLAPPDSAKTRMNRIPEDLKVLTALHFFATGNGNKEIGKVMHMSQPQVCRNISEVVNALISSAPDPELPALDSEFNELYGLPGIIGAVDATHVPIKPPSGVGRKCPDKERFENPLLYKNSAKYFSINVEIVSSSSNRVLFCRTTLPGSSTKSMLWSASEVREAMIERHVESNGLDKLIAGSGYDCEPWLLTPCRQTYSSPPETRYNAAVTSALQDSVRLTIGLLKGRFKCLGMASGTQLLHYAPDKAAQVVTACCALHNLLMDFGEEMPELAIDELDLVEPSDTNETNWDGLEARNSYMLQHFR